MDEENYVKDYFENNWENTHNADRARSKNIYLKNMNFLVYN